MTEEYFRRVKEALPPGFRDMLIFDNEGVALRMTVGVMMAGSAEDPEYAAHALVKGMQDAVNARRGETIKVTPIPIVRSNPRQHPRVVIEDGVLDQGEMETLVFLLGKMKGRGFIMDLP